jgi:hypothetical protein
MKRILQFIIGILLLFPLTLFAYVSVDWSVLTTNATFGPRDKMGLVLYHPPTAPIGWNQLVLIAGDHQDLNDIDYSDVWNTSNGVNWTKINSSIPQNPSTPSNYQLIPYNTTVNLGGVIYNFNQRGGDTSIWQSTDGVTWTEATPNSIVGGFAMINFTTVVFNNSIYVMGGHSYSTNLDYNRVSYSIGNNMNEWSNATQHAQWVSRTAGTACVFKGNIYYGFGCTYGEGGTYFNDLWKSSDGITWTQVDISSMGFAVSDNAFLFTYNGYIWIYAPLQNSGTTPSVYAYSSDGITWYHPDEVSGDSFLNNMREQAVAIMGNNIISVGGYNSSTMLDTNLVMSGFISMTGPAATPSLTPTYTVTPTYTPTPIPPTPTPTYNGQTQANVTSLQGTVTLLDPAGNANPTVTIDLSHMYPYIQSVDSYEVHVSSNVLPSDMYITVQKQSGQFIIQILYRATNLPPPNGSGPITCNYLLFRK